jgi:hypothetical protein
MATKRKTGATIWIMTTKVDIFSLKPKAISDEEFKQNRGD